MNEVTFNVIGVPAPQGSKSGSVRGGRAIIIEGTSKVGRDKHARWRADVTLAARAARVETLVGPLEVTIDFYLQSPKTDPYRTRHASAPDIDKLGRAVLDSLTNAALIRDDGEVCTLVSRKWYAHGDQFVGATIRVVSVAQMESDDRSTLKQSAKEARKNRA